MDQNEMNQKLHQLEKKGIVGEILFFNSFITPKIILALYWIFSIVLIVSGIINIIQGGIFQGLGLIFFGPLFVRLYAEFMIVFFKSNEYLKGILENTRK